MARSNTTKPADLQPATEADAVATEITERQVPEGEGETLVIPPNHQHDGVVAHDEPRARSAADEAALADHVEVRASELAAFCRAEAATFGGDPKAILAMIGARLGEIFAAADTED